MGAIELNVSSLISDSALKGYWRFEANLNDTSASGYNLTDHSTNDSASGKFTRCRGFTGTQYADIARASAANIYIAGSQTWGCWFSPVATNATYYMAGISDSGRTKYIDFLDFQGQVQWQIAGLTTNTSVLSSNTYTTGWNFAVGRYDGAKLSVFLNGTWTEVVATGTPDVGTSNFSIGRIGESTSNLYSGLIDDFWIFNRALTNAEVQYLYDGTPLTTSYKPGFLLNFI